ncbi:Transmembrane protein 53 [Aphelenchoides fujianensis]|nr:Transmembrane protein 53 [Aphelenchoides fujianensis]
MHSSWYRSLILPAASVTIAVGGLSEANQQRRQRSSARPTRSAEGSPKPLPSSLLAAALITTTTAAPNGEVGSAANVETPPPVRKEAPVGGGRKLADSAAHLVDPTGGGKQSATSGSWAGGCNPLGLCASGGGSQTRKPTGDEQQADGEEVEVDRNFVLRSAFAASSLQTSEPKGTLSANVSSTQLEEYAVARFTVPIAKVRSFSTYRRYALQIYEEILQAEPNRPIFFHVFSMNGASLFTALRDLLEHLADGADIKQRVRGDHLR